MPVLPFLARSHEVPEIGAQVGLRLPGVGFQSGSQTQVSDRLRRG